MTHTDMRLAQISIEKLKFTVIACGVATGDKVKGDKVKAPPTNPERPPVIYADSIDFLYGVGAVSAD